MKIIWIYRVYADANTHITTWRETHRQLRDRHEIHYVFAYKREPRCFTERSVLIRKLPWAGLAFVHFLIAGFLAFLRLNRSVRPDVVILDQFTVLYSLVFFLRRRRPAFILDLRQAKYSNAAAWHSGRLSKAYMKWMLRLNRRHHDGISYISEGLRQQLLADMRMPLHPRHLIWPSGVDPETFAPRSKPPRSDNQAEFNLFFHGSVTDGRGLAETIDALPLLRKRGVRAVFTIVGEGPYLTDLRRHAEAIGAWDYLRFQELVPYAQVPELIAASDVCIMAYPTTDFWEGNVPIKLIEYMAMEKVVLTTPVRAFRAITRNSSCAHFVPDNAPSSIADGIEYLHAHRAQLPEWGKVGREIVCAHFTWKAISDDLDTFITQVVRDHRQTQPLSPRAGTP